MIGLKTGIVKLSPYDPDWASEGERTCARLRKIFGSAAADIQHIGSTSIGTISAKPIIDIAVCVPSLSALPAFFERLESEGFHHNPQDDEEWQFFFYCGTEDFKTHYIHIVESSGERFRDYVNLRNYLRDYPDVAEQYAALKQALAEKYPCDREAYTLGKADFITYALRKALAYSFLGKTVTVSVDRPAGTFHPEKPDVFYPINYGFLPGVTGTDGEEMDVYILDEKKPLKSFTGRILAIVHRENDIEDKLVAAAPGIVYNAAQITEKLWFREKNYKIRVETLHEKSCGAALWRKENGKLLFLLLLQMRSRTWSFPKGHEEAFEGERETAVREVSEETGVDVCLFPSFRQEITYPIRNNTRTKTVVIFLADSPSTEINLRRSEIREARWVTPTQAKALLPFPEYSAIVDELCRKLEG